ncbi:MAG: hypothetical protein ACRER2_19510 [Methylococcales bacterium]
MISNTKSTAGFTKRRMILATATAGLPEAFATSGFHRFNADDAFSAFHAAGLWIGPRDALEEMPSFKQIIPYVVVRIGDRLLRYTRASSGGEDRLHGRMSIGLGGHIDLSDIVSDKDCVDLSATFFKAAQRELEEEVGEADLIRADWIGVLVDQETQVGRVHIGVVGVWNLRSLPAGTRDPGITDLCLCSYSELEQSRNQLERWSANLLASNAIPAGL